METITFNKGNWSGKSATISVQENTFELFGYKFTLEFTEFEGVKGFKVVSPSWEYPLAKGYEDKGIWYSYDLSGMLSRDDKSPFVAAAQVLCNLI